MGDAWELARDAARTAGVELRPCDGVADAPAILDVMAATWGGSSLLPTEVIRALEHSGNVTIGAFEGSRLVGFVLGWAGVDESGLHLHSHMLATLPGRRDAGVGYALKLAQRARCLDQGIHVVRWTFDPMVARNAHVNLSKLGALVERFDRAFYGEMRDELNRGERTDRFTVRWELDPAPGPWIPGEGAIEIQVPADHHALRAARPEEARRSRDRAAAAFEDALAGGRQGVAFVRERSCYVFARDRHR
jgi:predicted GNAT superfamily acetyltransferase